MDTTWLLSFVEEEAKWKAVWECYNWLTCVFPNPLRSCQWDKRERLVHLVRRRVCTIPLWREWRCHGSEPMWQRWYSNCLFLTMVRPLSLNRIPFTSNSHCNPTTAFTMGSSLRVFNHLRWTPPMAFQWILTPKRTVFPKQSIPRAKREGNWKKEDWWEKREWNWNRYRWERV